MTLYRGLPPGRVGNICTFGPRHRFSLRRIKTREKNFGNPLAPSSGEQSFAARRPLPTGSGPARPREPSSNPVQPWGPGSRGSPPSPGSERTRATGRVGNFGSKINWCRNASYFPRNNATQLAGDGFIFSLKRVFTSRRLSLCPQRERILKGNLKKKKKGKKKA